MCQLPQKSHSSLPQRSHIFIWKTLERIRKSYLVKMIQNMKYYWQRICLGRSRSCLYRSNSFFNLRLLEMVHLIVTGSCNSSRHQRFMREILKKNVISENSMTSEILANTDLLSVERYELKNRLRWFRWWIWPSTW